MAKVLTVTGLKKETRTSQAGKPFDVVVLEGTSTYQGKTENYSRAINVFSLEKNPQLKEDIASVQVGDTVTITYDTTQFKNIDRVVKGNVAATSSGASTAKRSSANTGDKVFTLTDASVRLGALTVAAMERPGTPVDIERVKVLMKLIRTGEGLEDAVKVTSTEHGPF